MGWHGNNGKYHKYLCCGREWSVYTVCGVLCDMCASGPIQLETSGIDSPFLESFGLKWVSWWILYCKSGAAHFVCIFDKLQCLSFPVQMPYIFLDLFCKIRLCMPQQMIFLLHFLLLIYKIAIVSRVTLNLAALLINYNKLWGFFLHTHAIYKTTVLFFPCWFLYLILFLLYWTRSSL